jgi:hypothetical protein
MGLQAEPPDQDEWVRVFSSPSDDPDGIFARQRAEIREALAAAGIDSRQQPYLLPDHTSFYSIGESASARIEVGILVHRHDQPQAVQALAARQARIHDHVRRVTEDPAHDQELARLSFEAGRLLDDDETAG